MPDPLQHTVSAHWLMLIWYLLMLAVAGVTSPRGSNVTVVGALFNALSSVPYWALKLSGPRIVDAVPVEAFSTVTLAPVLLKVSVAKRPFCNAAFRAAATAVSSC